VVDASTSPREDRRSRADCTGCNYFNYFDDFSGIHFRNIVLEPY